MVINIDKRFVPITGRNGKVYQYQGGAYVSSIGGGGLGGGQAFWVGTQAEYDALGEYNVNTFYYIEETA